MPEISIIVPVYNVEQYLEKCINSILSQTFTDFELILVVDGSTDNSGAICQQYVLKDDRIKVIYKENGGLSTARNVGLDNAEGKYIGFVDSDDYIDKNMFLILYEQIIEKEVDLVICDFELLNSDGTKNETRKKMSIKEGGFSAYDILNEIVFKRNWVYITACNKLYKKNLFEKLRFKGGKIHEDEFIVHEILIKCENIYCVNQGLYKYIQTEKSIMRSEYNIKRLDVIDAYRERVMFFYKNNLNELAKATEETYWDCLTRMYVLFCDDKTNKKRLQQIKYDLLRNITQLSKNPIFKGKHKLLLIIFLISPKLYKTCFITE